MSDGTRWSVPAWDTLFVGRRASLGISPDCQEVQRSSESSALPISRSMPQDVAVIANKGQDQLEKELQGALEEEIPGSISSPSLTAPLPAHLADLSSSPTSSQRILQPPSTSTTFANIVRESMDESGKVQPSTFIFPSLTNPKGTSSSARLTAAHALANGINGELAKPPEAWQPNIDDHLTHHHIGTVGEVHRAGRQHHRESSETDTERAIRDAKKRFSDIPAGQWAEGATPAALTEEETEKDLFETISSIFGINFASSMSKRTDESEDFFGAASRLQGILGESENEEKRWKKEQQGEIDQALQHSLSASAQGSSASVLDSKFDGQGQGYEEKSGIRHQPTYLSPRLPIVFQHGLFGFDKLDLAPAALRESLPSFSVAYWRGIADTLKMRGVEVLVAKVPMSASIEERAESLRQLIEKEFPHREINLIGHSMGGLDGRYLASKLDTTFTIRSLTTIATPHHGSTFADYLLDKVIGKERLPKLLKLVENAGLPGGGRAFACLTTHAMKEFNQTVHDSPKTIYMSWGAAYQAGILSEFRIPWGIIKEAEGDNDGLVSVESSKWAEYRGTLTASHLDLIGWTNRVASLLASVGPGEKPFDPKALYLTICEDLALRGL